jgi:TonB family protein
VGRYFGESVMRFKLENTLGNAFLVSIVIHTSVVALIAGTNGFNFLGNKETQIELIPSSALGIGDDITAGSPSRRTAVSAAPQMDRSLDSQDGLPAINDGNSAKKNNQETANDNIEGDDYGRGGSGDGKSGSRIFGSLPVYPVKARESGREGSLVLRLNIEPDGTISDIAIRVSSGYKPFDEAAEHALRKWRFRPVYKNGVAIARIHDVRVKFRIKDIK